jgi:hypothetical protein
MPSCTKGETSVRHTFWKSSLLSFQKAITASMPDSRRLDNPLRSPPSSALTAIAQQKVFKDDVSLAPRKRHAACSASYVMKRGLLSGFDFD